MSRLVSNYGMPFMSRHVLKISKHDEILKNLSKWHKTFDPDCKAIPRTAFDKRAVKKDSFLISVQSQIQILNFI